MQRWILLALFVLAPSLAAAQQADDCSVEINGALKGASGNIQDHMFHSLAIDPRNENVVYAGTETSGIFKTTDGGLTWIRLRLGFKCTPQKTGYSQIFDIAIDPTDSQILYAAAVNGPGPVDNPISPSSSGGVYKSTDGGASWVQKNSGFSNSYVTFVKVDATNHNRLYAGLGGVKSTFGTAGTFYEGGIWTSNNAGDSWTALPTPAGFSSNILIDMELTGANQRTIYANGQLHGSDAATAFGFARSVDGGQTWSISNPAGTTVYEFGSFKGDPNIIYAHDDTNARRLHKSINGGVTWTPLNAGLFGPIRVHPSDSQTVLYLGRTSIRKTSDGFASQRETYNDPDLPESSQMVDIRISESNRDVVWACAKGYYLYKSTNGGESFTKITAIRDLIYGNSRLQEIPAVFNNASLLTGIALLNSAASPVAATLTAYANNGTALKTVSVSLPAGNQVSRLASEWFGNTDSDFHVRVAADKPGLSGFFLQFDPGLTTMAGANVSNRLGHDFILPAIQDSELSIANPGALPVDVAIRWFNNAGGDIAIPAAVRIPANGRIARPVGNPVEGYVRLSSDQPFYPAIRFSNALYGDGGSRLLYAPQYVVGGGYQSTVTIINLENIPATVNVTWTGNTGGRIGQRTTLSLAANGRATFSGAEAFGVTPPAAGLEGYLAISGSSLLTGSVRFGAAEGGRCETSLPLVSQGLRDALFAQVAQDSTYFTGLAVVNNNAEAARVTVTVFNSAGVQMGRGDRTIPPNGRLSQVLTQIDPSLPAMSSGYFKVSSDRNVLSFAVFGTHSLSVLAGLSAQ